MLEGIKKNVELMFGSRPLTVLTSGMKYDLKRLYKEGLRNFLDFKVIKPARAVRLDKSRCVENPIDCAKCMHVCPEGVFITGPEKPREPGVEKSQFVLNVGLAHSCTECGQCVAACPNGALSL